MGKYKDKNGYVLLIRKDHPRAYLGKIREHILVMENYLERFLPEGSVVHHRNRIRHDNRIENLLLLRNQEDHSTLHAAMDNGKLEIVQAIELWSYEFMFKLKAGLPISECYKGDKELVNKSKGIITNISSSANSDKFPKITELEQTLFNQLKEERQLLAIKNDVPTYVVSTNETLKEIAKKMPTSESSMLLVKGIGERKLQRFGPHFIQIVKKFKKDFNVA